MRLYYHPASTTSRIVQLFAADQGVDLDYRVVIGCSWSAYPNIERWLGNMKALESWPKVHETIDGFAGSLKGKSFVAI